jgi:hypothetical protein
MSTSLGFTVTEIERRPEPVCPDPFIVALERVAESTIGQAEAPPCQPPGARLGLAGGARE